MKRFIFFLSTLISAVSAMANMPEEISVFITLGQSNADGSAFAESKIDSEMSTWYENSPLAKNLKIWYSPTQVRNDTDFKNRRACHVVDGAERDMPSGWMDLWYKNDNKNGRTAMNMIHGAGTYSEEAAGRRGIEGQLGRRLAEAFPQRKFAFIKLGVSGSGIDTWANNRDDTNWRYFMDSLYTPAMTSLLDKGYRPRLAGVWWMQGEADRAGDSISYASAMERLIRRLRSETGFPYAKIFIGTIPAPGESDVNPKGSSGYSDAVRQAQIAVVGKADDVSLINTSDKPMQVEKIFPWPVHFSHAGINRIADQIADSIISSGLAAQSRFEMPGKWGSEGKSFRFYPAFGHPSLSYRDNDTERTVCLDFGTWRDEFLYPETGTGEWELVWEDSFDRNKIDYKVWSKIPRGGANWNDCMSDAIELYDVKQGSLILRGMRTTPSMRDSIPCVTGGLFTEGKKRLGYGRLEVKARLTVSKGQWPAIWLLPEQLNPSDGYWPGGGEIDVMERLNFDEFAYQTIHTYYSLVLKHDNEPPHFATGKIDPDGYNVYTVEITPDSLSFYINDIHTFTYPRTDTLHPGQYPFIRPMYLLVDMQLGGSWVGDVDLSQLPVEMKVDRVSFYRRKQK